MLPLSSKLLEPKSVPPKVKLINSKQKQAYYYNLIGKALLELRPGQTVKMKRPDGSTWTEAVCKKTIGPRSFVVVSGVRTYRRNRRQLRMVPLSDSPPVAKQAAKPLRSVLQAVPQLVPPPYVTRSGRIVKRPARFRKFATFT